MPPIVAAGFCFLFIFAAFKINFDRKENLSLSLFIPFLWLLIIASRPVPTWFQGGGGIQGDAAAYAEGSAINRVVIGSLMLAGIIILAKRKLSWSTLIRKNAAVFLWFAFCFVSIFWSEHMGVSLKRWIKGLSPLIMVLVVLTDPNPKGSINAIFKRLAYILIPLSILLIKYYPHMGVHYSLWGGEGNIAGVTTDKNALGRLCLVTSLFLFWDIVLHKSRKLIPIEKREFYLECFLLLVSLWLLNKTDSATAFGLLLISISIFFTLNVPFIRRNISIIGFVLVALIVFTVATNIAHDIVRFTIESLGRDLTLTDRTHLWADLLEIHNKPMLGFGYDSFWLGENLETLWDIYWWRPNESHNGYLEVYLELGYFGLVLLGVLFLSTLMKIKRTLDTDFDFGRMKMIFFVVVVLYNITEVAIKGTNLIWFTFLLISVVVGNEDVKQET